jgi:hypothetical protein
MIPWHVVPEFFSSKLTTLCIRPDFLNQELLSLLQVLSTRMYQPPAGLEDGSDSRSILAATQQNGDSWETNHPPLKAALILPTSPSMSFMYPATPLICKWAAEKISATDPTGIPFPFIKSRKQVTISEIVPFSILMIFKHSPWLQGRAGEKF